MNYFTFTHFFKGHKDKECRAKYNPDDERDLDDVNTQKAEQVCKSVQLKAIKGHKHLKFEFLFTVIRLYQRF